MEVNRLQWITYLQNNKTIQMSICVHPIHKRIYFKPGKVAGTTIFRKALQPMGGWIIKKDNPNEFNYWMNNITDREIKEQYFKFTFSRNPFDRLISAWNDIDRDKYPNFRDFVYNGIFDENGKPKRLHYQKQTNLLGDTGIKNFDLDFYGKVENLNKDWEEYCKLTGTTCVKLGYHAKSEHKPFQDYYDEELMTMVALIYENDFKEFNYRRKFNVKL